MPNADQYRLMSIKNCGMDPKYLSIKINGNQCRSTWSMSINVRSIDLYWEVLKQFVRHWLKLIFFIGIRINCTILIGINQYWLALGIHWGSSAPCYKRCIMGWVLAVSASIEQADITLIFEWWFQNVLVKIFFSAMSLFASFLVLLLILVEAAPPTASSVPTLGMFLQFCLCVSKTWIRGHSTSSMSLKNRHSGKIGGFLKPMACFLRVNVPENRTQENFKK